MTMGLEKCLSSWWSQGKYEWYQYITSDNVLEKNWK
jgi:hypothetical protein